MSDQPISEQEKKEDLIYAFKNQLYKNLRQGFISINEQNAVKPGSSLHYIELNDLLRRALEPIQMEGVKYLVKNIFGDTFPNIQNLKQMVIEFFKNPIQRVYLSSHTSLGQDKKYKKNQDSQLLMSKHSNYVIELMLNMGLGFIATLTNIQKQRIKQNPESHLIPQYKRKLTLRYAYTEEEQLEAALASIFCGYGLLHVSIRRILQKYRGKVEQNNYLRLSESEQMVYDKYCNVSYHLLNNIPDRYGLNTDVAKQILQFHHSGLNETGYPKRKLVNEKVSEQTASGFLVVKNKKAYDYPIFELTRLAYIVNFAVEKVQHTPFHLPFNRDSLARHLLLNSIFPLDEQGQEDRSGRYDLDTKEKLEYGFDGYLVLRFLESIHLYKVQECLPVFQFNSKDKLYDAVVVDYNQMPHRPVIQTTDGHTLDLSLPKHENLYLGEYTPSLYFQDVLKRFKSPLQGLWMLGQKGLKHSPKVENSPESSQDEVDQGIENLLQDLPPGIAKWRQKVSRSPEKKDHPLPIKKPQVLTEVPEQEHVLSQRYPIYKKEVYGKRLYGLGYQDLKAKTLQLTHVAYLESRSDVEETYRYVCLPKNAKDLVPSAFEIDSNTPHNPEHSQKLGRVIEVDEFYTLLYFPSLDELNTVSNQTDEDGKAKYIVRVKKVLLRDTQILFVRLIQEKQGQVVYVQDKNCGKKGSLERFPFFKLGCRLKTQEVLQALQVSVF